MSFLYDFISWNYPLKWKKKSADKMSSGSDDDRDIVAAAAAAAEQFNHDNHENLSSDEGRNTGI